MKKILLTGAFLLLVLVAGGYWAYSEWGETTVQGAIEKSGRRGSQVIGAIDNDQTAKRLKWLVSVMIGFGLSL